MPSVTDVIIHCQKQIKKEPPEEKLLHYLSRLDRLRVALQDLMDTGVGRTVNQLSRHDGPVGHVARKLVRKWKAMVSDENSEDSEDDSPSGQSSSSSGDEEGENEGQKKKIVPPSDGAPIVKTEIIGDESLGNRSPSDDLDELPHRLNGRDYPEDPDSDASEDRLCIADEDTGAVTSREDSINIVIKKENLKFLDRDSYGDSGSEEDQSGFDIGATQPVVHKINGKLDSDQEYLNSSNNNNKELLKTVISKKSSRKRDSSSESEGESSSLDSPVKQRTGNENRNQNKNHIIDEFSSCPQRTDNGSRNSRKVKKVHEDSDDERDNNRKSLQTSTTTSQHQQIPIKNEIEEISHKDHHKSKTSLLDAPRSKHSSSKEHRSESRDRREKHSREKHSKHEESRKHHKNSEAKDRSSEMSFSGIKIKVEPNDFMHDESQSQLDKDKDRHDNLKHSSKHKDKSSKKDEDKKERHSKHKHKEHKDKHRSKERDESRERKRKHEKEMDKHERKRKGSEGKDKHRSKSSSSPEHKKPKLESDTKKHKDKSSSKLKKAVPVEEIDSTSGLNFGDALGCFDQSLTKVSPVKKGDKSSKQSVIPQTTSYKKTKDDATKLTKHDSDKVTDKKKSGHKHLESVIPPTLNISPFYKPSGALHTRPMSITPKPPSSSLTNLNLLEQCDPGNYWEDSRISSSQGSRMEQDDALSTMMSNRNQRTKVYSGVKAVCTGEVPRLFDLSMQVIKENIQDLGYTGGVPFDILKPALERATSTQLFQIEECNPYLIGETDELWKFHSKREFRGREPQELESWRELYERCIFERDEKFAIVRKKMLKKGEVAEPVRKAKLAYVEPVGGTRFNRHKATTIKNGMRSLKIKEEKGPKKGVGTSASVGFNNPVGGIGIVEEQAVIINPDSRTGHASRPPVSRESRESTARVKPRRAPLMAKTMKFIKTLTRR